jgi:hypothetical protein
MPFMVEGQWCGYCDERTRLIDLGDTVRRCTSCHPKRGHQLPQHRKCQGCGNTIFAWDNSPCGSHDQLGHRPFVPLPAARHEADPGSHRKALIQAAESRAQRGADLDAWWAAALARERREIRLGHHGQDERQEQPHSAEEPGQHAPASQR